MNKEVNATFFLKNLPSNEVKVVEDWSPDLEKKMILKSLKQEEENEMYEHDEFWSELLSANTIAEWKVDSEDAIWK